ncbi:MAG: hypothetical protein KKH93_02120 [Candidatus Omnitrophica bacterium]|nr:hypothetical protein [Candidatus Omnitrophota bacterium]MBU2043631.1 hypothetical protein [Candidatus Omnitrophota bacterium]MBU2251009.1 hypothetical protein [Candidatus Omnitrophota bacterium]
MNSNYDLEALKKRGFLKARQEGFFTLRTSVAAGNYQARHLLALENIANKYARGFVHLTVRQGIEIPFIKAEDIDKVEQEVKAAGIKTGASGPRLRATTSCPGNNWCKRGLVDTFYLFRRIEELGISCGLDLPHKFKIVISGCPNHCTRAETSEIGISGEVDFKSPDKKIGYVVYLGGCGGTAPRVGFKLGKIFNLEEVLLIVKSVVTLFKVKAKPRQRLALLIEEIGRDKFLQEIGL